jgi:CPA2 family monovalent cation:H+ antiporter-2
MGVFAVLMLEGAIAMGGIGGLLLFGRVALPWLLRLASGSGGSEVLMVVSVAFAIGAAALTTVVGLSPELGAFLGGFLLSSTPFRHHLSGQIGTIRDLFIAIFFTVLGMRLELETLIEHLPTILVGVVALLLIKAVVIGVSAWVIGATIGVGAKVGLSLAQAGEFGLVVLIVAGSIADGEVRLLEAPVIEQVIAVIILSLIVTPVLIELGDRLDARGALTKTAPWVRGGAMVDADQRRLVDDAPGDADRPHVIVAGFGVVGRAVCDRLSLTDATVTVVELNVETVRRQRTLGRSFAFGDVSDPEVLENAGIHHADALVLTMPDEDAVLRACRVAKKMHPDVFIVARTNFLSRAMVAHNLGANETVVEEMATAEKMDQIVMRALEGMGARQWSNHEQDEAE